MSLEALTKISRYYGANSDYVIAGGGNTSFKDEAALYVKGSGTALAEVESGSFVQMNRAALDAIWKKSYGLDAEERERAVLADMMAARKPGEEHKRPSVETLLHDLLPFAFVVHTHPALVNGLTCSQEGSKAVEKIFGAGGSPRGLPLWIPSMNPGYILSLAVKEALDERKTAGGKIPALIFLQNHGVFVGADTVEDIHEQYRYIMEEIGSRLKRRPDLSGGCSSFEGSARIGEELAGLAAGAAAFLRNREIERVVESRETFGPVSSAFTPDHIVYAGSDPLFVENPADLKRAWKEHLDRIGRAPKIAAVRGLGVFGLGVSPKAAQTALDLFTDALKVAVYAESFGGERFMAKEQIDFINNWEVERYRSQQFQRSAV